MSEKDELQKLKDENEALKIKLNPLSDKEISRLTELTGLIASTLSSAPEFQKLKKEYIELTARNVGKSAFTLAPVTN